MAKRDWIYVGLMVFLTAGLVVDALLLNATTTATTWSRAVQSFVSMIFVYWWEIADANQFGKRRSSVARLLTFFLPPVGHAIYLYQGRSWKPATTLFLLFWAGVFGLSVVGAFALTPEIFSGDYE